MFEQSKNTFPFWLGGVIVAIILIVIGTRVSSDGGNPVLREKFAADSAAAAAAPGVELPRVSLPQLPGDVQKTVTDLQDRFKGGQSVPGLTPIASGSRVRINIGDVKRNGGDVQVIGSVTNISDQPIDVPASAFSFRDSSGTAYAISGDATSTLKPGQSTDLDLSLPLPESYGLTLVLTLPPDPPLEQVLLVQTTS